jgi:hypothetical protein
MRIRIHNELRNYGIVFVILVDLDNQQHLPPITFVLSSAVEQSDTGNDLPSLYQSETLSQFFNISSRVQDVLPGTWFTVPNPALSVVDL